MARKRSVITYDTDTWIAVYVLAKTEHFEIRTRAEACPGYKILSHAEAPLGTALTSLFYLETENLSSLLYALIRHVEAITPEMTAKELNTEIEEVINCEHLLWFLNPVFAPFILAAEKILGKAKDGVSVPITAIAEQYEAYKRLLPTIKKVSETCLDAANYEIQNASSASKRYFLLQKTDLESYPVLRFETMKHELVESGYELSWPFSEYRTGERTPMIYKDDDYSSEDTDVLETTDLNDIVYYLIARCLDAGIRMKKCKYCGRYFAVTDNYGAEYCNRLIDGSNKTCREIGSVRLYDNRMLSNPITQAFKRSYKTHNARIRYGYITKEQFTEWSKKARAMRDQCLAGEITLDEFNEWLDSDKMR